METIQKSYIDRDSALEIIGIWGIEKLPRINREWMRVPSIASMQPTYILGKDKTGFYLTVQK